MGQRRHKLDTSLTDKQSSIGISKVQLGVCKRVVSKKGGFGGRSQVPNRNEGTFRCSPVPNKNRDEGTFGCSPVPKKERGHIRQNRPFTKPPFCFLSAQECFFPFDRTCERNNEPKDMLEYTRPHREWAINGVSSSYGLQPSMSCPSS